MAKAAKVSGAKSRPGKDAADASIMRRPAQAGFQLKADGLAVAILPPAERMSLRAPAASVMALSKALGMTLPVKPKTSASTGGRTALWLGPDEWLVIDETGKDPLADCAGVKALHSAVGISHRNVAFSVTGKNSEAAISAGCPQDLSLRSFPAGGCSRTILGKVEIVVYRQAEDTFRVECWRSFSDYVRDFLTDAARDAAA